MQYLISVHYLYRKRFSATFLDITIKRKRKKNIKIAVINAATWVPYEEDFMKCKIHLFWAILLVLAFYSKQYVRCHKSVYIFLFMTTEAVSKTLSPHFNPKLIFRDSAGSCFKDAFPWNLFNFFLFPERCFKYYFPRLNFLDYVSGSTPWSLFLGLSFQASVSQVMFPILIAECTYMYDSLQCGSFIESCLH